MLNFGGFSPPPRPPPSARSRPCPASTSWSPQDLAVRCASAWPPPQGGYPSATPTRAAKASVASATRCAIGEWSRTSRAAMPPRDPCPISALLSEGIRPTAHAASSAPARVCAVTTAASSPPTPRHGPSRKILHLRAALRPAPLCPGADRTSPVWPRRPPPLTTSSTCAPSPPTRSCPTASLDA